MEAKAEARYIRISPQKARLVVDLIRGQKAGEALTTLRTTNKRIAPTVEKVLQIGHRQCAEPNRRRGCGRAVRDRGVRQRRAAHEARPAGADGPRLPVSAPDGAYRHQGGGERKHRWDRKFIRTDSGWASTSRGARAGSPSRATPSCCRKIWS